MIARTLAASPIGLVTFAIALTLTAAALRTGLVADDAVTLWAGAIGAGGGTVPLGRIIASYPTLPFIATTLLEFVTPKGTPAPALFAAGMLGMLAFVWSLAFRKAGFSPLLAAGAALMIALHPAMLSACLAGAADICLVVFLYLFGNALFDLRARSAAPQVMTAGLALLGLAFSHPVGAAIDIAVVPLFLFAVSPSVLAHSTLNVVLALVFPTVFAVGAFAYVSWVFPGAGWSFLADPAESLAAWGADAARILPVGSLTLNAMLAMAVALPLGAPVAPVVLGWIKERRPLSIPPLVFAGAVVATAGIAALTGWFGNPSSLAAAVPVLAAVTVARVPLTRDRRHTAVALLVAGWFGGLLSVAIIEPRAAVRLGAALDGVKAEQAQLDALALGGATATRDGVLIDTDNAPAVVLGRGNAHGLVSSSDEGFALALLLGRLDSPFVAVPDPHSAAGIRDRLNKTFPRLYRDGAPGYRLAYENKTWRLYARQP